MTHKMRSSSTGCIAGTAVLMRIPLKAAATCERDIGRHDIRCSKRLPEGRAWPLELSLAVGTHLRHPLTHQDELKLACSLRKRTAEFLAFAKAVLSVAFLRPTGKIHVKRGSQRGPLPVLRGGFNWKT